MNKIFGKILAPKYDVNLIKRCLALSSIKKSTCQSIKKYHFYSSINSIYKTDLLSNRINNYFIGNKNFGPMINKLSNLDCTSNFKNDCKIILDECKVRLEEKDTDDINDILQKEYFILENSMNNNNYYKHELVNTDILTAYLIVWCKDALTDIHYHASNGCYCFNLKGSWEETIYKNFNYSNNLLKKTHILKSGDINFINNFKGAHQIKFLGNLDKVTHSKDIGISINIYSPTNEL
jgi:hypothetical protein